MQISVLYLFLFSRISSSNLLRKAIAMRRLRLFGGCSSSASGGLVANVLLILMLPLVLNCKGKSACYQYNPIDFSTF